MTIPNVVLTKRYAAAVAYAAIIHAGDVRKGTEISYLCHLLGVSSLVIEAGGDEDQAIAGLLHDAVEDAGGMARADDIRARFGDRVTEIVIACSDSTDEEWKRVTPYGERKRLYLDRIKTEPMDYLLVTMADKVHNARAIVTDLHVHGAEVIGKFNGDANQVLDYYQECLAIAKERNVSPALLVPLELAVNEMTSMMAAPAV
jgi:(p)ppGpp synthase/HD superfamily hydrolase